LHGRSVGYINQIRSVFFGGGEHHKSGVRLRGKV